MTLRDPGKSTLRVQGQYTALPDMLMYCPTRVALRRHARIRRRGIATILSVAPARFQEQSLVAHPGGDAVSSKARSKT